ncbi:ankyrin repeat domain-containing protein [Hahella aquimaris]|uniref:ankyrin repeat domain-containing protein n=1 Tax=Hahella sp. HNIBRBA332 TaxID=3015983 RepID=UPI00273B6DB0|nr:ankyrin repeat domain-containing protein [Hahella sp. HNIBRBA332]WLQ13246.1 ankyrin repeat domain-containing protein [Hahella sp. HNIBRBA332]
MSIINTYLRANLAAALLLVLLILMGCETRQPLMEAAIRGDSRSVQLLSQDDVNQKDQMGRTALIYAASHGHLPIVRDLVERGGNINTVDYSGLTPLMAAVLSHRVAVARYLLERKAAVNAQDVTGTTILVYAINTNVPEMVQLLLRYGADPTLLPAKGTLADIADNKTAYEHAVLKGNEEIIRLIKEAEKKKLSQ